jgi:hypothetical protein
VKIYEQNIIGTLEMVNSLTCNIGRTPDATAIKGRVFTADTRDLQTRRADADPFNPGVIPKMNVVYARRGKCDHCQVWTSLGAVTPLDIGVSGQEVTRCGIAGPRLNRTDYQIEANSLIIAIADQQGIHV